MPSEIVMTGGVTLTTPGAGDVSFGFDSDGQMIAKDSTGEQFIMGHITRSFTLEYSEYSAASTVETINKFTMPAKWTPVFYKYHLETAFAASGLTAAEITMKTGTDLTCVSAWDVFQTAGNEVGTFGAIGDGDEIPDVSTTNTLRLALQTTGANIDTLTAGKVNIDVTFYVSP